MKQDPSIDPTLFDTSIKPTDDFFGFVNNAWIKKNPVPPEESRWGSFDILRVDVEKELRVILDELITKPDQDLTVEARKVRDFYKTALDIEKLEALKDAPLAELFKKIDAIETPEDLARTLGFLHRRGVDAWWSSAVEPDAKKSDVMALYLGQSGIGLPDRDYYLNTDEKSEAIRKKYTAYIEALAGHSSFTTDGVLFIDNIMQNETRLARASMTRVELRDIEKQYNKMSAAELQALAPAIQWKAYFEGTGVNMPEYFIVCQPEFFKEMERLLTELSVDELKSYLRWHIINSLSSYLGEEYEKKMFDFYGRTFRGATEMRPRWRRVLGILNALLDEAVGKLYVERHFSEDAKKKINTLVDHLVAAYRVRIGRLDWMGDDTKKKALTKLDAITRKLGYPDTWKDTSALEIGTASYAENFMNAHMFEFDRQMKKIGKPVDRSEWYMSPQTVNACYSPLMNEILFPAAILQPPFFDPNADDAVNFGGIGTVIGHELTHGFDDQGARFDPKGNLENWWTAEDKERFDKKTKHLAEQFDAFEMLPGLHVNGNLTLGENIADLGAMLIAHDALMLVIKEKGGAPDIDGLTPLQRFFVNYTITERGSIREEDARLRVQIDPHSPSKFRVNGPLSNLTEFYDAFDGKEGDALWRKPDDRVAIW